MQEGRVDTEPSCLALLAGDPGRDGAPWPGTLRVGHDSNAYTPSVRLKVV